MTCTFEIVQRTMSDCHVELWAWMWNAPKSDWSQILGHKSTFCWETRLLRGWEFISFHEKTCLPAGKTFKDCYLPMWRERDECNFATWVRVLWDFWNWLGRGKRLDVICGLLPEGKANGWHRCVSFFRRSLGKIMWMARSSLFLLGAATLYPTNPSDEKLLVKKWAILGQGHLGSQKKWSLN